MPLCMGHLSYRRSTGELQAYSIILPVFTSLPVALLLLISSISLLKRTFLSHMLFDFCEKKNGRKQPLLTVCWTLIINAFKRISKKAVKATAKCFVICKAEMF